MANEKNQKWVIAGYQGKDMKQYLSISGHQNERHQPACDV